jgi:hypothetical protein
MMAKQFYFYFGNANPGTYTGLSPTFIIFNISGMSATPAPGITEFFGTGATGIYGFQYGSTASAAFVIDGGSTLTISSIRYIVGSIDPVMSVDQSIGYQTDSFGSTNADPTTLFGQVKRAQEFNEGNKVYTKSNGLWDIYSRGSSALLREKALVNSTTSATSS